MSLADTPYYHCVARCVRRAYLCGVDRYSGTSYEHRRQWLEDKLHETANAFAIKLCAYAVMSNHYHVVLRVQPELAEAWSDREVIRRWHSLFAGSVLSQRFMNGDALDPVLYERLLEDVETWRSRLCDISWYMRIVNEFIAREANKEDDCTGRFWEGRFKSQALLDERALLSCMAYVDLNPIRAKMAKTPETSNHTSIKARIDSLNSQATQRNLEDFTGIRADGNGLPFKLADYIELVDWTGRIMRQDKRGAIASELPPILERLGLNSDAWQVLTTQFETQFQHWVGSEHIVRQVCSDKHYQRIPSTVNHRQLLG
ncbi:transposase [Arenicella chitinivorans]|uniref:Transposase n=1 Tax=Arenicella chitinivorans TaxID=1329800 RepID=A0A918S465_9GAMM|nr:transposase [Arenicella chitinivorans]